MSGGSLEYLYIKVRDVADDLKSENNTPSQIAFGYHLEKVAKALHDIEWVMSGDYSFGEDEESIQNVFGKPKHKEVLDVLNYDAITLEDSDGKNFVGIDREDFGDLTERLIKLFDQK